jgi:hypothetical protein
MNIVELNVDHVLDAAGVELALRQCRLAEGRGKQASGQE